MYSKEVGGWVLACSRSAWDYCTHNAIVVEEGDRFNQTLAQVSRFPLVVALLRRVLFWHGEGRGVGDGRAGGEGGQCVCVCVWEQSRAVARHSIHSFI